MKFALFTLLLFLPLISLSQEKLSIKAQVEDLNFLVQKLEEIHPDPYGYLDKDIFYDKVAELKGQFENDESSISFAKKLMPLISSLGDAHTEMEIPEKDFLDFQERGRRLFPFSVDIQESQVFIRGKSRYEGAEIIRINQVPIRDVLSSIATYISAERREFREAVMERLWRQYVWFELGEVFAIELKQEGKVKSLLEWEEAPLSPKRKAYEIELEDSYAYLNFRRMENLGAFQKFLKQAFREIQRKGIDSMIIDLRENGGVDSRLGDELISYLYSGKYRQVASLSLKTSDSQKTYFYQNYIPFFIRPLIPFLKLNPVLKATFGKSGKTYEIFFKEKRAKTRKIAFEGEVFVLIGPATFSSAAILANSLETYKMAELLGNKTGGIRVFYGDNIYVELPNSSLRSSISFKKFVLPGAKEKGLEIAPHKELLLLLEGELKHEDLFKLIRSTLAD